MSLIRPLFSLSLSHSHLNKVSLQTSLEINSPNFIYIYIRRVQVTPGVTLKIYTFFKPLDLSRSNGQKKILINANILIDLIYYLLFNTFYTYF